LRLGVAPSFLVVRMPSLAMVQRELLSSLRSVKAILILMAFILMTVFVVWSLWPAEYNDLNMAGYRSKEMVAYLSLAVFCGCALFVPAYSASAMVLERERSTYDFLRMSLISSAGVVMAKLFNAVGMFIIMIVAMTPVICSAFFLIGVDYTVFIKVGVVVLSLIFSCASIGLACSSIFRKSIFAVVASYIGMILLMAGPVMLSFVFATVLMGFQLARSTSSVIEAVAEYTSPFAALTYAVDMGRTGSIGPFITCILFQLVVTVGCLLLTWRNVYKPPKPPKITLEKPIDDVKVLRERKVGFPFYILDPLKRKKAIADGRNPMMVREIRWGLYNRATTLVRVFYVSFVVYFIAGGVVSMDASTFSTLREWFAMQTVLTVLAAPALIANTLTKEYELGNLDMLRMTLLKPKDIIFGKFAAGFASMIPMLAASFLSCLPMLLLGVKNYEAMLIGFGNLFVCTVMSISIGLFASMLTRQTTTAILISYVIGLILFCSGPLIVEYYYYEIGQVYRYEQIESILFSPITVMFEVVGGGFGRANIDYGLWFVSSGIVSAISLALVLISTHIFLRYKMQDR